MRFITCGKNRTPYCKVCLTYSRLQPVQQSSSIITSPIMTGIVALYWNTYCMCNVQWYCYKKVSILVSFPALCLTLWWWTVWIDLSKYEFWLQILSFRILAARKVLKSKLHTSISSVRCLINDKIEKCSAIGEEIELWNRCSHLLSYSCWS